MITNSHTVAAKFNINSKKAVNLLFFTIIVLFLTFRLLGVGMDMSNSDAVRWHRRSTSFLDALKTQEFEKTYQRYHPGVTLMLLNAPLIQAINTYNYTFTSNPAELTLNNSSYYPTIDKLAKIQLVSVLALLLVLQLVFVTQLFNVKTAFVYGFLVAVEPYLIGIDRWFHLTSLETYLTFLAFLVLLYWTKTSRFHLFILASILLGLATLTKVTAIVVLPLFLLIIVVRFSNKLAPKASFELIGKYVALLLLGVISVWLVLFPALWVRFEFVVLSVLDAITGAVSENERAIPYEGFAGYFYYLAILVIKLSPITQSLLLLTVVKLRTQLKNKYVLFTLSYVAIFYVSLSMAVSKIDRYAVSLMLPLFLLIAASISSYKVKYLLVSFVCMLLFVCLISWIYYPNYSSYYSPLLGRSPINKALNAGLYDNSGEYYMHAAQYLNVEQPQAVVWVPHNRDPFTIYSKRFPESEYSSKVNFAVTSVEHFDEISEICPREYMRFGTKYETVVGIFLCGK